MKTINIYIRRIAFWPLALVALLALSACGSASTVNLSSTQPQQTVTVGTGFQSQMSPIPTIPPYRCGAWTSNNAPNPGSTISVYARLTHNLQGVQGMTATAIVHFQNGDATLDQATSDQGGYVTFKLALQDRQPTKVPATVDVTFSGVPGGAQKCTTFFTPM
ncbi:MAG TPA: hypothetical protein VN729_00720 [Ktedonobacteraceae bacterium]|nr:hypothetical protein [Ktedonobacteraceae bacterium]